MATKWYKHALSFQALPPSSLALLSPYLCSDVEKTLYYTWEALGCRAKPGFAAAQASQGSTLPQQGSPHSPPCQAPAQESLCKVKSLQVVDGFCLWQRA